MRSDPTGEFYHILAGAAIGAAINMGSQMLTNLACGLPLTDGLVEAAFTGAITGAAATSGLGFIGQAAVGAATNAASYVISQKSSGRKFDTADFVATTVIGGISGLAGGKGLQKNAPKVTSQLKIINSNLHAVKTNYKAYRTVVTCLSRISSDIEKSIWRFFAASTASNAAYTRYYTQRHYK